MIETKYGMKYHFPHSLVHINDNSSYVGDLPIVVAPDPSMYASLVVTALPMGVDNKIVTLTRSDVANIAFGISTLTANDRSKFGQTVDYPLSIINQGVPVRLLRVTPEGSKHAFVCIVVQWRLPSGDDANMHVRFKEYGPEHFPNIFFDKFENTKRLNEALIKAINSEGSFVEGEGADAVEWNQAVLMTVIGAGRGSAYNNMSFAINPVSQTKRPANARYTFTTINNSLSQVFEEFSASLININNASKPNAVASVNTVVNQRLVGSSVLVPYVNEAAIKKVYDDYMNHFKLQIEDEANQDQRKIYETYYAFMNINIFDILYGKYLYNGGLETSLPFYQVDTLDSSKPRLAVSQRIREQYVEGEDVKPTNFYAKLKTFTKGIDECTSVDNLDKIGDINLAWTGNSRYDNPRLQFIAMINQYTGAITTATVSKLYPLAVSDTNDDVTFVVDKTAPSRAFKVYTGDIETGITTGKLVEGDIIAVPSTEDASFKMYCIVNTTGTTLVAAEYTDIVSSDTVTTRQLWSALDWTSAGSGVENIVATDTSTTVESFNKIGMTVINTTTGFVYVNDYARTKADASDSDFAKNRILVSGCTQRCVNPLSANVNPTNLVSTQYDLFAYESTEEYELLTSEPADWDTNKTSYFKKNTEGEYVPVEASDEYAANTYYKKNDISWEHPKSITRYLVSSISGSLYIITKMPVVIPANYYNEEAYGISLLSEDGGVQLTGGYTGFFDDDIDDIVFKYKYSALLVRAYHGEIDSRILSPTRVPAKYLFDGGTNTVAGLTVDPSILSYKPADMIAASTIFTADEKDEIIINPSILDSLTQFEDIDVKQAMYDLMDKRIYQNIPEDKRPVGPGSGMSLHLDGGITDANTAILVNNSFARRFTNPNASWDLGGYVSTADGNSYTYVKRIVDGLFAHCKRYSVNKPFTRDYTTIYADEFTESFPDIDASDWEKRELYYNSCANTWVIDTHGNLIRTSQRTLKQDSETSDLIQESNMRTLTQLVFILQTKIDSYLLEYSDDSVIQTLNDEVNNMFSNWVGNLVDGLTITFKRDLNIDGGDILVCNVAVVFRGLILRVPIIVDVNRRTS